MRRLMLLCALLLATAGATGETVYITNQLKAGLHEEKSLDSPIVKIVSSGERMEIVKREEQLSFVRDGKGASGWINNDYLMAKAPAEGDIKSLQNRAEVLEQRLAEAKERNLALEAARTSQGKLEPQDALACTALDTAHSELQQQYKREKLKVGELQIALTELRNRLGQDSDTDALYRQIKSLEESRLKLEVQLANALEDAAQGGSEASRIAALAGVGSGFSPGMRTTFIFLLITLVLGLVAGAYLMDLLNRRRHGGFRI